MSEIEFNNGFLIAIALFLEHKSKEIYEDYPALLMSGAKDHLYDLQIPISLSKKLKNRILKAQKEVLDIDTMKDLKVEDISKYFTEFEDILIEVDKELFGYNPEVYYR